MEVALVGRLHRWWEEQERDDRHRRARSATCSHRPRTCTYAARRVHAIGPCTRAREPFVCSPETGADGFRVRAAVPHAVRGRSYGHVGDIRHAAGGAGVFAHEVTNLTWSPDEQCLMLSSRDGYCTLVTVDEIPHAPHAAAAQHSVPISSPSTPLASRLSMCAKHHSACTSPFACIKKHPPLLLCVVESR
ncbi:hypothetical protein B0H16DRAFT_636951 [Mycena metata]|uniref:Uncharacterized protein n=1 Tax=Mycena metata TaxID=1033252 RepID=A0AAD7H370_9AGAR|nr:hypothetical protein B0H16DRAFT_636951 [Mycena metata]